MNTGSVDTTYARPSAHAAQAFQVFSSWRRGVKPLGTLAATRSRSQAPTNGVAPSAATTARIRVPVVDEKSNRPPVTDDSASNVKAYRLGANSYVRKPMSFRELLIATQQIAAYWLLLNERPPTSRSGV